MAKYKHSEKFKKLNIKSIIVIIIAMSVLCFASMLIRTFVAFHGTFMPMSGLDFFGVKITGKAILKTVCATIFLSIGVYIIFGKMVFSFFAKGDKGLIKEQEDFAEEHVVSRNTKTQKIGATLMGVFALLVGSLFMLFAIDGIGFLDDTVILTDTISPGTVKIKNEDLTIFELEGYYMENRFGYTDDYIRCDYDKVSLILYDGFTGYYEIRNYKDKDGELMSRVNKIVKKNKTELKTIHSKKDFEDEYIYNE